MKLDAVKAYAESVMNGHPVFTFWFTSVVMLLLAIALAGSAAAAVSKEVSAWKNR